MLKVLKIIVLKYPCDAKVSLLWLGYISSSESQFGHKKYAVPSVQSSCAHFLHSWHWTHVSLDLLNVSPHTRHGHDSLSLSSSLLDCCCFRLRLPRGSLAPFTAGAFPFLFDFLAGTFLPSLVLGVGLMTFAFRLTPLSSFCITEFLKGDDVTTTEDCARRVRGRLPFSLGRGDSCSMTPRTWAGPKYHTIVSWLCNEEKSAIDFYNNATWWLFQRL